MGSVVSRSVYYAEPALLDEYLAVWRFVTWKDNQIEDVVEAQDWNTIRHFAPKGMFPTKYQLGLAKMTCTDQHEMLVTPTGIWRRSGVSEWEVWQPKRPNSLGYWTSHPATQGKTLSGYELACLVIL